MAGRSSGRPGRYATPQIRNRPSDELADKRLKSKNQFLFMGTAAVNWYNPSDGRFNRYPT